MNLLIRIYFFTGLVILTLFSILISMLDLSKDSELFICTISLVGLQIGFILILLAISSLFGLLNNMVSDQLKLIKLIIPGIVIGMLLIVITSLLIDFLYGSNLVEPLIYRNAFMCVTLICPVFLLWPIIKGGRIPHQSAPLT